MGLLSKFKETSVKSSTRSPTILCVNSIARDQMERDPCHENWVDLLEIWEADDAQRVIEAHLKDLGLMPD